MTKQVGPTIQQTALDILSRGAFVRIVDIARARLLTPTRGNVKIIMSAMRRLEQAKAVSMVWIAAGADNCEACGGTGKAAEKAVNE